MAACAVTLLQERAACLEAVGGAGGVFTVRSDHAAVQGLQIRRGLGLRSFWGRCQLQMAWG